MDFHRSAFKHGHDKEAVVHAVDNAVAIIDFDPDSDPPKVLAIEPDATGNLLEIIWLQLEDVELVIHAMRLRPTFYDLLPTGNDES